MKQGVNKKEKKKITEKGDREVKTDKSERKKRKNPLIK